MITMERFNKLSAQQKRARASYLECYALIAAAQDIADLIGMLEATDRYVRDMCYQVPR